MDKRVRTILLYAILFALSHPMGYANMASPEIRGSNTSEAYSSRDIDILSEHISIFFTDFYQVKFTITYNIRTDRDGKQIPLIFDTMTDRYGEKGEFKVWVDDTEIPILNIPSTYENPNALVWIDSIDKHLRYPKNDVPNIIGLKYFEVDIPAGEHTIKVEYTAIAGVSLWRKVKEYDINYNLKPARYWRSFGTLDIEINTNGLKGSFSTNLSGDDTEIKEAITYWHFDELPQDDLKISYKPDTSTLAKAAIAIGPEGFSLIFILILISLNIVYLLKYRSRNIGKRFSPVVIIGGLIVPFIYCIIFMYCYSLVDWIIGDYASERHGYTFFVFFLYPFMVIGYMCILFIIDSCKKHILQKKSKS